VIIRMTTIVAAVTLSSALLAAQTPGPAASEQTALIKSFAEIQPIDVHTHIYKDDRELSALIKRLNLRAVNICVVDDRDPDFNALKPQRTEVLKVRRSTHGRVAFCTVLATSCATLGAMKDQHERDLLPPSGTPTEKFKYERVWFIGRLRDGYNHTCELPVQGKTLLEARDECNSLNSDLPIGAGYRYKPFRLAYRNAKPLRRGKRGREHTGRS
jgi:hypothetical protein